MGESSSWLTRAACRGLDPELFFPTGATAEVELQTLVAVSVCRTCPVADPCLAAARRQGITHGIWGGVPLDGRGAPEHLLRAV